MFHALLILHMNMFIYNFLRYRHTSSGELYGKTVWKHYQAVRAKLSSDEPSRQGWLRLLKDIGEYMMAVKGCKTKK